MKQLPSYVARRTDSTLDATGLQEVILSLLERGSMTLDQIHRRLIKDGVRKKRPFTEGRLERVLLDMKDLGFISQDNGPYTV